MASAHKRTAEPMVHTKLLVLIHEHHEAVAGLLQAPLGKPEASKQEESGRSRSSQRAACGTIEDQGKKTSASGSEERQQGNRCPPIRPSIRPSIPRQKCPALCLKTLIRPGLNPTGSCWINLSRGPIGLRVRTGQYTTNKKFTLPTP